MSREGSFDLVSRDAGAVVLNPDGSGAALFDGDRDPGGAGVDGVFDEFLDGAPGLLDDLAGGDLGGRRWAAGSECPWFLVKREVLSGAR